VVLTGGHTSTGADLFYDGARFERIEGPLHPSENTHGSGCTQSSALAGLIDVLSALGQPDRVPGFGDRLRQVELTADERDRVRAAVADPAVLDPWLPA